MDRAMHRIVLALALILAPAGAQAVDLKSTVTAGAGCTPFSATSLPEPGALGINRADGVVCYKDPAGNVLSGSLLLASATGRAAILAANAAALATAAGLSTTSTPTFAGLTITAGPTSLTGKTTIIGGLVASGTTGYAPITVVGNPGSGWGTSVEWQGNAVVTGFDGGNNTPKIQSRTGGAVGGALGTGYGNLGLNPEGGNVGVGTTSPRFKLEALGTLGAGLLTLSAAPTTSNIPSGVWTVVKRTDDGTVKQCANDGGTIKCGAAWN